MIAKRGEARQWQWDGRGEGGPSRSWSRGYCTYKMYLRARSLAQGMEYSGRSAVGCPLFPRQERHCWLLEISAKYDERKY